MHAGVFACVHVCHVRMFIMCLRMSAQMLYVSVHVCLFCSVFANVWFVCIYLGGGDGGGGGGGGGGEFCVMHVHMYKFQVLLPGTTYLIQYYGLSEL